MPNKENKYNKYLGKDNERKEPLSRKILSGAKFAVGAAAVIGGGYSSIKYLRNGGASDLLSRAGESKTLQMLGSIANSDEFSNVLRKTTRYFDEAEATINAFGKTVKSSGYSRLFSGKADDELRNNLVSAYRKVEMGAGREISGEPTKLEKILYDVATTRRSIGDRSIKAVRLENVLEEVDSTWSKNPEIADQIKRMLISEESGKNSTTLFDYTGSKKKSEKNRQFLDTILKNHSLNAKLDKHNYLDVSMQLPMILNRHSLAPNKKSQYIQKNKDKITSRVKDLKSAFNKSIIDNLEKQGMIGKASASVGMHQLTVGEAIKQQVFKSSTYYKTRSVDIIDPKTGKRIVNEVNRNPQKILESLLKDMRENDPESAKLFLSAHVDPQVLVNSNGKVLDTRVFKRASKNALNTIADNTKIPIVNLNPAKMIRDMLGIGIEQPTSYVFKRGTQAPTINNSLDRIIEDRFFFNGQLYDSKGIRMADGHLASSVRGTTQRVVTAMSDHTINKRALEEPTTVGEFVAKKIFDIGYQEHPSSFARKSSFFTKFDDEDWVRNIWDKLVDNNTGASNSAPYLKSAFNKIYRTVDNNVTALDTDTLELISPYLKDILDEETIENLISGDSDRSVMKAINELIYRDQKYQKTYSNTMLGFGSKLKNIASDYKTNPESFDIATRVIQYGYDKPLPDAMEFMNPNNYDIVTRMDEARKILHSELLYQIDVQGAKSSVTVGSMVNELARDGAASGQIKAIERINAQKELQKIAGSKYLPGSSLDDAKLKSFSQYMATDGRDSALEDIIYEANPKWGLGPGEHYSTPFDGNDYLFVNKAKSPIAPFKRGIEAMNDAIKNGGTLEDVMNAAKGNFIGSDIADATYRQLGFGRNRAGRENLDQITNATITSFHIFNRLNEGVSKLGLALSSNSTGSTQDLIMNLGLKRIALPLAALGYLSYANDELGNISGEKPTQTLVRSQANLTIGMQTIKEVTGINSAFRNMERILPGSKLLKENPLGIAVNFATFGAFTENRSPEEMRKYYENGYDPVKRGRFWLSGSSTPIYGEKVKYWQPSLYRRAMGDPYMTDSLYGSTREYWANSPLPNLRNPLGALNPLTWGHWERKHYEDRPYPVSSTGLEDIPIVGPFVDGTLGRVIDPIRRRPGLQRAHEEYLKEINELIKYNISQSAEASHIYVTPGGRMTPVQIIGDGNISYSQGSTGGMSISGESSGTIGIPGIGGLDENAVPIVGATDSYSYGVNGGLANRQQLTSINRAYASRANISPIDTRSIHSLRDNVLVDRLDEAVDPNSLAYRLGRSYYSLTEIGGIYGFGLTSFTGDLGAPKVELQSSSRMTSLERHFWDQELGGLGGDLSEIYRRFLPHRRRQIDEYNPFRNKMPDWLPGPEYFTDFKHSDPFVKVPKGEMFLPGAGYESMHELHPDFFGEYGAVDRMLILSNIAPYSQQYKYYNSVVGRMNNAGMIDPEAYDLVKAARERVRETKKPYDLYPYKFVDSELQKEEVTITRVLDSHTFLTAEYGNTPIQLAGINMPTKADESESARMANEYFNEIIAPGNKVQIGLTTDALNRIRDDTRKSMHAVVYDRGLSVNRKLARMHAFGEDPAVKGDYDSTDDVDVHALYTKGEITVGKVWERFAHMDTPIHTKLLQVRSPLEMYKRRELYGKSWRSWSNPIRDWVVPTVDSMVVKSPIMSTLVGAGIGYMFGSSRSAKKVTSAVGAFIGATGSSVRTVGELANRTIGLDADHTWIPKRRREQREIDEYFDFLSYLKYKGLYAKARKVAIQQEGIDPEDIVKRSEEKSEINSSYESKINSLKKWLKVNQTEKNKEAIKELNSGLNALSNDRVITEAGPITIRALQYKQQYESTLYGADPYGDLMNIHRAMPKKDRAFFQKFLLAKPKEREEILRLVPENQKRFYQAKWGLEVDPVPTLGEMLKKYNIPGENWAGWDPKFSMEEVKLKFTDQEGLEAQEFGFWIDDIENAKDAPTVNMNGLKGLFDSAKLKKVLMGAGVTSMDIQMDIEQLDYEPEDPISVAINVTHDRAQDIKNAINDNFSSLFA